VAEPLGPEKSKSRGHGKQVIEWVTPPHGKDWPIVATSTLRSVLSGVRDFAAPTPAISSSPRSSSASPIAITDFILSNPAAERPVQGPTTSAASIVKDLHQLGLATKGGIRYNRREFEEPTAAYESSRSATRRWQAEYRDLFGATYDRKLRAMNRFLFATLLCTVGHFAFGADTDGDGLLDLIDVPGFNPNVSGEADFVNSGIQDLDGAKLLTNATGLNLRTNQITSIENGDFEGLNNLQTLFLGSNPITNIENGAFQGLNNLQALGLPNITSIESGDFEGLDNLPTLGLYENQITSLEKGAFQGLDNLRTLKMGANPITTLEDGVFEGLNNLLTLDLGAEWSFFGGQISAFEDGALRGLENLQTLDLRGNPITYSKLNLTDATFRSLSTISIGLTAIVTQPHFTDLVLDRALLSLGSFQTVVGANQLISNVSLAGLTFLDGNPANLSALLNIPTLDNVRVDQALFNRYAAEFNAFASISGNIVTVVPEPSTLLLCTAASVLVWTFHRRRRDSAIAQRHGYEPCWPTFGGESENRHLCAVAPQCPRYVR
jgi:Leucine-rich repeat (LRR) protein